MTRQREHDARRIAAGWRRVRFWAPPETVKALGEIKAALKCSEEEAVRMAIAEAGR